MNQREIDIIMSFSPGATTTPTTETASKGEIVGRNLTNLFPRALTSLSSDLNALANLGAEPDERPTALRVPDFVNPPVLAEDSSLTDKILDTVTGAVAPEVAAAFVPYLGGAKLARLQGMGGVGQAVVGNLVQGQFMGADLTEEERNRITATGTVLGAAGGIPSLLARAGIGAGVGAADYMSLVDESPAAAKTAAAVDFLAALMPIKGGRPSRTPMPHPGTNVITPNEVIPPGGLQETALPGPTNSSSDRWWNMLENTRSSGPTIIPDPRTVPQGTRALPGPIVPESGKFWNMLEWPHGEAIKYLPSGEAIQLARKAPSNVFDKTTGFLQVPDMPGVPREITIDDIIAPPRSPAILEPGQGLPASPEVIEQFGSGPRPKIPLGSTEYESGGMVQNFKKGKTHVLPEYMRTQGGFAANELLQSLGLPIAGGLTGAAIGEDAEQKAWLAALGAGTGLAGARSLRTQWINGASESGGIFVGPKSRKWSQVKGKAMQMPETQMQTYEAPLAVTKGFNKEAFAGKLASLQSKLNSGHPMKSEIFKLGDIMQVVDDNALDHYPQLRNINVILRRDATPEASLASILTKDSNTGVADLTINVTDLLSDRVPDAVKDKSLMRRLAHEINHFVQDLEGYPQGSSPEQFRQLAMETGDSISDQLARDRYSRTHGELMSAAAGDREIREAVRNAPFDRYWNSLKGAMGMRPDEPAVQLRDNKQVKLSTPEDDAPKIIESGIQKQDKNLEKFAKSFQEKIKEKAQKAYLNTKPSGLKAGDLVYSKSTGKAYEFMGDAPPNVMVSRDPAKVAEYAASPQGDNRVYIRDPFTGEENSMYHWGIDWEKTGVPKPTKTRQQIQDEFRSGKLSGPEQDVARLQKQTDTPEFKKWFGESKVVDDKGQPLVLYHGTQKSGFTEFFPNQHFGTKDQANEILRVKGPIREKHRKMIEEYGDSEFGLNDSIYPVYLSIKNPKRIKDVGDLNWQKEIVKAKAEGHDGLVYWNLEEGPGDSYIAFNPNQIKSAIGNSGKFSLHSKDITGATTHELLMPILGGTVGSVIGGNENGSEGAIAGGIIGASGGFLGSRILDKIGRTNPKLVDPSRNVKPTAQKMAKGVKEGLNDALNKPMKDLAGQDVYGRGGIMSKFARVLEKQFWHGLPDDIRTAFTRARGFASEVVDQAQRSLKAASEYANVPAAVQKSVSDFLDGKLTSAPNQISFFQQNGGITKDQWKQLSKSQKANYQFTSVYDPTTKQVTELYTPKGLRDTFLKDQEATLLKSVPKEWQDYANLMITSRRSMNSLQATIADAIPDGPLKRKLEDSIGRYVPRLYRIYTDPKYRPTDQQVEAAMREFAVNMTAKDIETAVNTHRAYDAATYQSLIQKLSKSNSAKDQARLARLQNMKKQGNYYMEDDVAEGLKKYGNDDYLRHEIENYIADKMRNKEIFGSGRGIDRSLFSEREDITPAFRDLLGEYTDPVERMAMGVSKVYPAAQAARLISMSRNMTVDGLKVALDEDEWVKMNNAIRQQMQGQSGQVLASLQSQLDNLNAYKKLPNDIKFGEFSGLYVNRFISDYLNRDSAIWDAPIGRALASFNRFFKVGHIPLNPVTQVRQWVSLPLFALVGRASPSGIGQAFEAYKTKNSLLRKELIREGIWTADFIKGELKGSVDNILNGRYDGTLAKKGKKVYENVLEAYRIPDMLIRGGTYIAAKNRFAQQLGKTVNDPEVIAKAVAWTDKFTMNYDNIAPIIRNVRNIPFVNPFISYQSEILRITKNLVKEGFQGDIERLAVLSSLASLPFLAQNIGEAGLNPQEKKEWERTKRLLPDYMRHQTLVPIRKKDGKFDYFSASPIVPHDALNQTMKSVVAGDTDALASINPFLSKDYSPLLNVASEVVTGADRRTGLQFRGPRDQVENIVSEILPPIFPGGYEWKRFANANVENLRTGRKEDWGDIALRYSTGVSPGELKPETTVRSAVSELKRNIANHRAYFQRVAQTDVSDEKKQRAYEEYRKSVMFLVEEFRIKMQDRL